MTESESVALPLGDAAIVYFVLLAVRSALSTVFSISKEKRFVNSFFEKNSNFFKKLFCVSKKYKMGVLWRYFIDRNLIISRNCVKIN